MQEKWHAYAVEPYESWSTEDLLGYLKQKGEEAKQSAEDTQDALVIRVRDSWYETEDEAQNAWINVKDWILDTWSDSQLKAFCDRHGIPVPQPRKRDVLLKKARESYEAVAKKAGETVAYPGNWLYESWKGECFISQETNPPRDDWLTRPQNLTSKPGSQPMASRLLSHPLFALPLPLDAHSPLLTPLSATP